jgi:transposase
VTFELTSGEVHEVKGYEALMELHDANPDKLLGDKGYDSDEIRDDLAARGIEPAIPPRSNRNEQIDCDRDAYKRRNLIERCVNRLEQFRRIATRYEKPPELTFQCYPLQPQGSGSKLSTRPSRYLVWRNLNGASVCGYGHAITHFLTQVFGTRACRGAAE